MTMYNTTQLQTISKNAAPNGVMPNALKKLIFDSEAVEAAKSKAKTPEPTTTVVQDVENQTQGMQEEQQAKQLALTVPPQVLQEAAQMAMQMQAPQGAPGPTAPQGIASLPPQGMPQGMPPQQVASVDQGVGGLPDTGINESSYAGGGIVAFSGATDDRSLVKGGENNPVEYPNPGANVQPTDIEELLRRAVGMTEEEKQAYRKNDAFLRRVEPTAASKVPPESRVVRAGGNDFNQQLGGINALPTELGTRALTTPTTTITFEPEALTTPTTTTTFEPGEALTTPTTTTASETRALTTPTTPTTTFEPEEAPGAQYFPQAKFSDFSKQTGGQGIAALPEAEAVPRATPTAPQGKVPKTVRYNNPLALWDTKTNDLRKYDTYEEGKAAGQRDLDIKLAGKSAIFNSRFPDGIVTPERLAEVWSPAAAKRNSKVATEAYGRYIANYLGIKPTDPIPPGKNAQVFEVMSQFESGIGSGKGAFKQSPTVVDPRDGGIRQFGIRYQNDPTITHDFPGKPGVGERLLSAVTGSKDAGAAEDNPNTKGHPTYKDPGHSFKQAKKGETRENIYPNLQDMGDAAHDVLTLVPRAGVGIVNTGIEALNRAHIPYSPYRFKIPSIPTDSPWLDSKTMTPFADRRNIERGEYDQYGNKKYTPKAVAPDEAPEAEEAKGAPDATTKPAKPVKAAWDQQSILDRAGDYGKYMGVNPQIERANTYATSKEAQAAKAEGNRMYDLMIRGGTQAALAAAKPGSGQGLAGLMNAASHGASAAADQNQVLTDRISALRKEGFDTNKEALAAQRAEKVSALKFGEDAYHHAGTIAASFANAESRQGGGKAAQMRAHASEFKAVLDNAAKDARNMASSPEDRKTARMQYNEMLEEYRSMAQRIARAEALEAGEDYTPGAQRGTTKKANFPVERPK